MPTTITGTDGVSQVQAGSIQSDDLAAGIGGKVLQVLQATSSTTTQVNTSTSFFNVEPSVTITPSSASNKILIFHTAGGLTRGELQDIGFQLERDGSPIWTANRYGFTENGNAVEFTSVPFNASYLDFPNTTSSVTYNFSISTAFADALLHNSQSTAITIAMEIAG
jgi:hypothetical protein